MDEIDVVEYPNSVITMSVIREGRQPISDLLRYTANMQDNLFFSRENANTEFVSADQTPQISNISNQKIFTSAEFVIIEIDWSGQDLTVDISPDRREQIQLRVRNWKKNVSAEFEFSHVGISSNFFNMAGWNFYNTET